MARTVNSKKSPQGFFWWRCVILLRKKPVLCAHPCWSCCWILPASPTVMMSTGTKPLPSSFSPGVLARFSSHPARTLCAVNKPRWAHPASPSCYRHAFPGGFWEVTAPECLLQLSLGRVWHAEVMQEGPRDRQQEVSGNESCTHNPQKAKMGLKSAFKWKSCLKTERQGIPTCFSVKAVKMLGLNMQSRSSQGLSVKNHY